MKIDVRSLLDGDQREEAWQLYETAFTELNALAVQRHLMYRSEFDEICDDERVQKWLALDDDGEIVGFATYTNHLESMHLISPAYFERRWPKQFAARAIWYCGFVATPLHRQGAFIVMVRKMYEVAQEQGGVISLDFCRHNRQLADTVVKMMARMSDGLCVSTEADAQSYWTYETAGHTPSV